MGGVEDYQPPSSDDEDGECVVWAVGDRCMVKWSDGTRYPATVVKFEKRALTTRALVTYQDFCKDDDEWVDTKQLRKSKSYRKGWKEDKDVEIIEPVECETSFFAPLQGDEERRRIQEKYRHLDDEENTPGPSAGARWPTTNRKLRPDIVKGHSPAEKITRRTRGKLCVHGGDAKYNTSGQTKAVSTSQPEMKPKKPARYDSTLNTLEMFSEDCNDKEAESRQDGFSDTDLERPYFAHVSAGPLEPFVLCEARDGQPAIQIPATMNRYLRDYQRAGAKFLFEHNSCHQGALLADDMGLGKTVQVIALIAALLGRTGTKTDVLASRPDFIRKLSNPAALAADGLRRKPFLVIGPASVLYNWLDEFSTWGYFTVGKYHRQYKAETMSSVRRKKLDVVVTTYETFRDNVDELKHIEWEAVFADEVHKIKGLRAEVTQALRQVNCRQRYGLTGTPLQNSVSELWSLLDWCNPGCLGDIKVFRDKYGRVIERGQRHNATKRELAEARTAQERLAKHRDKWMLRRLKTLIKDQLPSKSEQVVYCRATDLQISVYKAVFNLEHMGAVLKQSQPCPCGSHRQRGRCCHKFLPNGKSVWSATMSYMHLLLKAANHIALLLPSHTDNANQRREAAKICETVFASHPQFLTQTQTAAFRTLSDPKFCGKMKVLQGLLSVFKKQKSKVLLFSYSTKLLDILETYVMSMGYEFSRLDGQTKQQSRIQLVKQFNSDPNIFLFLISTKAGGVGLNLTGANVVIIYDPNWNPTHDLQAQDRAYRIGQRRDVRVYRLITSGTIEENIYLRQVNKQLLGDVAVGTKNSKRLFYKNELFGIESMFHFRTGDRCLTEDILERHAKIEEGLKAPRGLRDGGLEEFHIEKYVSAPDRPDADSAEGSQADLSDEEQADHADDSDIDTGGVGYVCSQLLYDLEASDGDDNPLDASCPARPPGTIGSTSRASPRSVRKQKHSNTEDFLEDLLDLGSHRKSPKEASSVNVTDSETVNRKTDLSRLSNDDDMDTQRKRVCKRKIQEEVIKSTKDTDHIFDEIWADFDISLSNNKSAERRVSQRPKSNLSATQSEGRESDFMDGLSNEMQSPDIFPKRDVLKNARSPPGTPDNRKSSVSMKCVTTKGGPFKNNRSADNPKQSQKQTSAKASSHKAVSNDIDQGNSPPTFLAEGATMDCDFDIDSPWKKQRGRNKTKKAVKFKVDSGSENEEVDVNPPRFPEAQSPENDATLGSVTDVFAQCGVVHTHHNRRVTAASRAEDHMSRCAIEDVYERQCDTQAPAIQCQPRTQSSDSADESYMEPCRPKAQSTKAKSNKPERRVRAEKKTGFFHGPRSVLVGRRKVLIGQTPKAIRKSHFQQLANFYKKSSRSTDLTDFAAEITKLSRSRQIGMLQAFYTSLDSDLTDIIQNELQTHKS